MVFYELILFIRKPKFEFRSLEGEIFS